MNLHDQIVERMLSYRGETLEAKKIVAICDGISYPSGTGPIQPKDHSSVPPLRPHCDFGGVSVHSDENCGTFGMPIFEPIKRGLHQVCETLYWSNGDAAG